jgi:hypothetical protein
MPTLTGALAQDGALVDVSIGLSDSGMQALRAGLQPVPSSIAARGLLDTGAEMTCVDSFLVRTLGLSLTGTTFANLPAHGGLTLSPLYDIGLTILHSSGDSRKNLAVRTLAALELSLAHLGFQVLIGRDVLAACRFVYDGPRNKFRLGF